MFCCGITTSTRQILARSKSAHSDACVLFAYLNKQDFWQARIVKRLVSLAVCVFYRAAKSAKSRSIARNSPEVAYSGLRLNAVRFECRLQQVRSLIGARRSRLVKLKNVCLPQNHLHAPLLIYIWIVGIVVSSLRVLLIIRIWISSKIVTHLENEINAKLAQLFWTRENFKLDQNTMHSRNAATIIIVCGIGKPFAKLVHGNLKQTQHN